MNWTTNIMTRMSRTNASLTSHALQAEIAWLQQSCALHCTNPAHWCFLTPCHATLQRRSTVPYSVIAPDVLAGIPTPTTDYNLSQFESTSTCGGCCIVPALGGVRFLGLLDASLPQACKIAPEHRCVGCNSWRVSLDVTYYFTLACNYGSQVYKITQERRL